MTTQPEADGFVTVTRTTPAKFGERYEQAAFKAHTRLENATFYLMLAYKHGSRDTLMKAREALETAIAIIDATEDDQ